jgi:hypothetical protein
MSLDRLHWMLAEEGLAPDRGPVDVFGADGTTDYEGWGVQGRELVVGHDSRSGRYFFQHRSGAFVSASGMRVLRSDQVMLWAVRSYFDDVWGGALGLERVHRALSLEAPALERRGTGQYHLGPLRVQVGAHPHQGEMVLAEVSGAGPRSHTWVSETVYDAMMWVSVCASLVEGIAEGQDTHRRVQGYLSGLDSASRSGYQDAEVSGRLRALAEAMDPGASGGTTLWEHLDDG